MKKRWLLMAPVCILLLFTAAALLLAMGKRPYKNLDAAQIASAKVRLSPPDKTVEIEDVSELWLSIIRIILTQNMPGRLLLLP